MNYLLLWLNIFVFYVYTLFPTVAAYRDAGEMVTVGKLLAIAHPPGYPLYTLLTNIFIKIVPIGNYAYRINIFSALFSSLSAVIVYHMVRKIFFISKEKNIIKEIVIYLATLIFAFNYLQWYLSLVAEMYTLNIFFVVLVLYLYLLEKKHNSYITFFVFSVSLANRLDIVLIMPFIFFDLIQILKNTRFKFKTITLVSIIILLGCSVYLYMIIRSSTSPRINWNNPSKLENFLSSIMRKTHGSTLDLLSINYSSGENFLAGLRLYFRYLIDNYTFIGIGIILTGIIFLYKQHKLFFLPTMISWLISCVWFIYKANLPPNPHAMAILEAHFLLPNVFVFIFFVYGIKYFFNKKLHYVILVLLGIFIYFNFENHFFKINKRENYFAYDYAKNLLCCLPKHSLVIIREDVQLFSLWYETIVCGNRKDIVVIAEGLSGSEWYQNIYNKTENKKKIYFSRINKNSWENFIENNFNLGNNNIYITYDVDFGNLGKYVVEPNGLCAKVLQANRKIENNSKFLFDEIMFYRDEYVYDLEKEFFSSDLIEDYSKARHSYAYYLMMSNYDMFALEEFKKSMCLNPDYPMNYFYIAYIYFKNKKYELSKKFYDLSVRKCNLYYTLAIKYNALSDVVESFKNQLANAYLHLGVVNEKLGLIDLSVENYFKAIELKNDFAQAYYNLGVIYWHKGDWDKVKYYFEQALYYDPNNLEARYYLEKIKYNVKK